MFAKTGFQMKKRIYYICMNTQTMGGVQIEKLCLFHIDFFYSMFSFDVLSLDIY